LRGELTTSPRREALRALVGALVWLCGLETSGDIGWVECILNLKIALA
jgi:hypothetical protein